MNTATARAAALVAAAQLMSRYPDLDPDEHAERLTVETAERFTAWILFEHIDPSWVKAKART